MCESYSSSGDVILRWTYGNTSISSLGCIMINRTKSTNVIWARGCCKGSFLRHILMQKTTISNPWITIGKTETWLSVSSITIWCIQKAKFSKAFQNVAGGHTQILCIILRVYLDNIKGNTQRAELQQLEFHAIWDKGIFYKRIFDKVEWFYSTPKYLFKPIVRT